jgi:DNA repair protein RadC
MEARPIAAGEGVGDLAAAVRLFGATLAALPHEELRCAYLDPALRPIMVRTVRERAPGTVAVPLRAIIRDALLLDAAALIMAHNHPSGSAEPSPADKAATRRLAELARPLGIRLIDHLIFAAGGVTSFRALGLL